MHLVLFDIDGTLLRTDGAGREAMTRTLAAHFGRGFGFDAVSFSGKTDPQIFREILTLAGHGEAEIDAELPALLDAYTETMLGGLTARRITVLPGVPEAVAALAARNDVALGLVTGNVERVAFAKLDLVGLAAPFVQAGRLLGGFGSDSGHRPDLPGIALDRAHAAYPHRFDGERVWIVGDTPHDLACGRGIGARAVGVATGHYTRDALDGHDAALLLDTLEDVSQLTGLFNV